MPFIDLVFDHSLVGPDNAELARSLAAQWNRAAACHVMPATCSCGVPAIYVSAADFETDLLSYLKSKWAGEAKAASLMEEKASGIAGLIALLGDEALPPELARAMLQDIKTAIASFAGPHGHGLGQRTR